VTSTSRCSPEQRAQRVLLRKRVAEITKCILDNEDSWVFSSLTAFVRA
jgi:hypothetical protein